MSTTYKQEINITYVAIVEPLDDENYDFTPMENEAAFQMQEYAENELKIENANNYRVSTDLYEINEIEVIMKFDAHFDFESGGDDYDEPRWIDCDNEVDEQDFPKIEKKFEEIIKNSIEGQGIIVREISLTSNDSQTYEDAIQDEYEKSWMYEKG